MVIKQGVSGITMFGCSGGASHEIAMKLRGLIFSTPSFVSSSRPDHVLGWTWANKSDSMIGSSSGLVPVSECSFPSASNRALMFPISMRFASSLSSNHFMQACSFLMYSIICSLFPCTANWGSNADKTGYHRTENQIVKGGQS